MMLLNHANHNAGNVADRDAVDARVAGVRTADHVLAEHDGHVAGYGPDVPRGAVLRVGLSARCALGPLVGRRGRLAGQDHAGVCGLPRLGLKSIVRIAGRQRGNENEPKDLLHDGFLSHSQKRARLRHRTAKSGNVGTHALLAVAMDDLAVIDQSYHGPGGVSTYCCTPSRNSVVPSHAMERPS